MAPRASSQQRAAAGRPYESRHRNPLRFHLQCRGAGKLRHVVLAEEAQSVFADATAGRAADDPEFRLGMSAGSRCPQNRSSFLLRVGGRGIISTMSQADSIYRPSASRSKPVLPPMIGQDDPSSRAQNDIGEFQHVASAECNGSYYRSREINRAAGRARVSLICRIVGCVDFGVSPAMSETRR